MNLVAIKYGQERSSGFYKLIHGELIKLVCFLLKTNKEDQWLFLNIRRKFGFFLFHHNNL